MKFAIITHTPHYFKQEEIYAYGPYVREMNLWARHVDSLLIASPVSSGEISGIHTKYEKEEIRHIKIPAVSIVSFSEVLLALFRIPYVMIRLFGIMRKADHIHLRCPGTIGLLGCLVQICFPRKPKTAKYAGNWDPGAKQPRSYRFQKWILSNTFLTRNMQVLVYGEWPGQSKNIKTFFTASYANDKIPVNTSKEFTPLFRFLFVGSLSPGKRPEYCLKLIHGLRQRGVDCTIDFFGEGVQRPRLEEMISDYEMQVVVKLHGNQPAERVEEAYRNSHFLLLPSQSEGWPKVVTESMFWGALPMATEVSCVKWMLGEESRGLLLKYEIENDLHAIMNLLGDSAEMQRRSKNAAAWSQEYTLENFETAIKELLQ